MSLSAERVIDLARVTGFREATLEKVLRLAEVLADVSRHPFLSTALVLKGGTALNLFFGEPRRLSVDLDFNYVAKVDRAGMLETRPEIERAVNLIGQARGYQVQRSPDTHAGRLQRLQELTRSDSPTAAELKERTWLVVAPLLDLDDAEREYTERIQGGDLRPELLFPHDSKMADRYRPARRLKSCGYIVSEYCGSRQNDGW